MNNKIGQKENLKMYREIILNGKIGFVETDDDNGQTIGVLNIVEKKTFGGKKLIETEGGFPLTKRMEKIIGWQHSFANIRMVTCDTPIDPTTVDEKVIESIYGDVESQYCHRYSDYTGYLWTDEDFTVGGHDLREILHSNMGKYIHMEIQLYK